VILRKKTKLRNIMKKLTQCLALASITALCLSAGNLIAQDQGGPGGPPGGGGGRGNWDPAQMQQRMLAGVRDRLDIKDDTEWKAIEPLVQKVMDLRREQMGAGMRGAFGRGGRGGDQAGGDRPRFGGEPSAEETALADAIKNNASKDDLKTKMAAYRKVKATKETELKAAQENLKKVLNTKQEAVALEMGLVQ
jgi:hypothetical protein